MNLNTIHNMDIFDLCDCLEDNSVDMILCDLPYGITACAWDSVIPLEPMWEAFKRIIKPRGAVVLTARQPFTSQLVMSNLDMFKYEWIWRKEVGTNFLNLGWQPMMEHETILLFSDGKPVYYPQHIVRKDIDRVKYAFKANKSIERNHNPFGNYDFPKRLSKDLKLRCPSSVLRVNREMGIHPTQKPVALFEYLIRTYTQPGDVVFDPCVGSGTTALAARNTGRNYIVGDNNAEYAQIARDRLAQPYTPPMFEDQATEDKPEQLDMEL